MTAADLMVAAPLLILCGGCLVVLLVGAVLPGRHGTGTGLAALLGAAAWAVLADPAPPAPTLGLAFTPFARFFTILFTITAAATLLLSHEHNERQRIQGEEYPATVVFAAFGMVTLSMATNLLILFLGLESLTFAFYILVAIDRNSAASGEAGLKYLVFGAVAAAFISFGMALIYAGAGTLQTVPAMRAALAADPSPLAVAGWALILAGIAFKVSLVPAHLWTPDVYEGAPAPVVGFLSTGSKGATLAALLLLVGEEGVSYLREPLWALALLSMVVGNLAALRQDNLKRMLAYSSVAQMGYVVMAMLTGHGSGFVAVIFYIVAYTAMNVAAFGVIAALGGDVRIEDLRGAGYRHPLLGGVLALSMLGLAGIPPTAGFVGKFFIFAAAIRGGEIALAVAGILAAAVSVYYYLRVVVTLYMRHSEEAAGAPRPAVAEVVAIGGSAAVVIILGVYPSPLLEAIELVLLP